MSFEIQKYVIFHEEKDESNLDKNSDDLLPNQTVKYNVRNCLAVEIKPLQRSYQGFTFEVFILQKYWEATKNGGVLELASDYKMQRSIDYWSCCVEVGKSSLNASLLTALGNGDLTDNVFKSLCWDLFMECFLNEKKDGLLHTMIKENMPDYYDRLTAWVKK